MNLSNEIFEGDCLAVLQTLPDQSVNTCVTSPPYYGLRDYEVSPTPWPSVTYSMLGQEIHVPAMTSCLGKEKKPEHYIGHMVLIFRDIKRVLRNDGTLWINIADSYAGSGKGTSDGFTGRHETAGSVTTRQRHVGGGIKTKDMIGVPWMLAFALRDDGYYLRQDIIWHKENPMPSSVTDRCTTAHEYIFLFSKSKKYYFDADAIKTPVRESTIDRMSQQIQTHNCTESILGKQNGAMKAVGPGRRPRPDDSRGGNQGSETGIKAISTKLRPFGVVRDRMLDYDSKGKALNPNGKRGGFDSEHELEEPDGMANKKSVWSVTTKPFKDAHFATFPADLISDAIKAGCPEGGCVLDPFGGALTTALVSSKLNRHWKTIELNPEYINIGLKRLHNELGMFNEYVIHR